MKKVIAAIGFCGLVLSSVSAMELFEINNGLIGMGRDIKLRVIKLFIGYDSKSKDKVRVMVGLCEENLPLKTHRYFIKFRSLATKWLPSVDKYNRQLEINRNELRGDADEDTVDYAKYILRSNSPLSLTYIDCIASRYHSTDVIKAALTEILFLNLKNRHTITEDFTQLRKDHPDSFLFESDMLGWLLDVDLPRESFEQLVRYMSESSMLIGVKPRSLLSKNICWIVYEYYTRHIHLTEEQSWAALGQIKLLKDNHMRTDEYRKLYFE